MNVEAVRNHSVFCAESVFYNKYNDVRIDPSGTDPERIHK